MCGRKLAGKKIAILGSTGSIGRSALKVIEANPENFSVCALAAGSSVDDLARQALTHPDAFFCMDNKAHADRLKQVLPSDFTSKIFYGPGGIKSMLQACAPDMALNAICGAAGLASTIAVLEAGVDLALANKESLVMGGPLVKALARARGAEILPVDSEHSAIWQVWPSQPSHIKNMWLTASGGPFLDFSAGQLKSITPAMALNHPKWRMGPKISIDSATLMNKGLEVIEASFLFDFPIDNIKVAIHPQSLVHGMLEMVDGSILAQIGPTDMQVPIALAINYPERLPATWPVLNLWELGKLEFRAPDNTLFPALGLAIQAGKSGGSAPAILNAANEVAINAFLHHNLLFVDIASCVEETLCQLPGASLASLDDVLAVDKKAREIAEKWVRGRRC